MRAVVDRSGRFTVPKALRDELGFDAGVELEHTTTEQMRALIDRGRR